MAHNLNQTNGKTSFVAVGQKAWHGLGTYVNEAMTFDQAIVLGGLDYAVEKRPIQVAGGKTIPDYFANVRKDTGDVLGVVSSDYHIVQNRDTFSFFDSIIDDGEAVFQTAGALGLGERFFITAKLPSDITVHGEQVESYLLLTSGHNGKTGSAIQIGFTPIRVVCQNTLNTSLRNLQNKMTILHFQGAQDKLKTAAKVMGLSSKYFAEVETIFNQMAQVKITDAKLRAYIEQVMKPAKETINKETLQVEHSALFTKKVNEIMDFAKGHETQVTDAAKGTLWGAYNSISGYFGWLKKYNSQEDKMNDIYFKAGAKKIETAFEIAASMM